MPQTVPDHKYTRRQFIQMRALQRGSTWEEASRVADDYAHAHPETEMTEERTYMEWEDDR